MHLTIGKRKNYEYQFNYYKTNSKLQKLATD